MVSGGKWCLFIFLTPSGPSGHTAGHGRLPRALDDGLVSHALNRGNDRATGLADKGAHFASLQALASAQAREPFRLLSDCPMTDHSYLPLRPGPGRAIGRILQPVTVARNRRSHQRPHTSGPVRRGQSKGPVIREDRHLVVVPRSIAADPLGPG
jgi:putative transposase